MKRIFTLLTIAFTLSFIGQMTAQDLVSTDPSNRNGILEEYTGIYCGYCPQGHAIAKQLMTDNPGRFFAINIHEGGYAVPQAGSGHPDFRTPWGKALLDLAGVTGFPMGSINREVFLAGKTAMSRGDWATYATQVMSEASPVNIGAKASWITSKTVKVEVELYFTADAPADNLLNAVLLESGVIGYQASGGEDYEHNHILRSMSSQWGETVEESAAGTLVKRDIYINVLDKVDPWTSNFDVVVYLTKADRQYIYTGIQVELGNDAPMATSVITGAAETLDFTKDGESKEASANLSNISANDITFVLSLEKSETVPSDWSAEITSHTETEVVVPAGTDIDVTFSVTQGNTQGFGIVTLNAAEKITEFNYEEPNLFKKLVVSTGFEQLFINRAGSNSVIAPALAGSDYSNIMSLPLEIFELGASQFTNLNTILMDYGVGSGFTQATYDAVAALVQNGADMVVLGEGTSSILGSLGAKVKGYCKHGYTTDYVDFNIIGYDDDPITGGYNTNIVSRLPGGSFMTIFSITNETTTSPILRFADAGQYFTIVNNQRVDHPMSAEEGIFGLRFENGDQKIVYLTETLSLIKDPTTVSAVADRILAYVAGLVSVEEFDAYFSNMTAAPNPFAASTTVEFNMTSAAVADMSIVDASGTLVKDLGSKTLAQGQNIETINSDNLASGLYFFVVKTGTQTQQIKLVISK